MGGHVNQILKDGDEFSMLPPYDHVVEVYDNLDRITTASYYGDVAETILLKQFVITYSADGHPIVDGVEYKNHILDLYSGRLVLNTISTASILQDNSGIETKNIKGITTSQSYTHFELLSNTPNHELQWPTSAETISCVSTSALDTLVGTGIRSVIIYGIDGTGVEINESIDLSGTTPVITTLLFKRINSIIATSSGVNEFAMGTISFTNSTSLQLIDTISPGDTRSVSFKYTIPLNKKAVDAKVRLSSDKFGEYEIRLLVWDRASNLPPYRFHHVMVKDISNELYNFPKDSATFSAETDLATLIKKRTGGDTCTFFSGELTMTELNT